MRMVWWEIKGTCNVVGLVGDVKRKLKIDREDLPR